MMRESNLRVNRIRLLTTTMRSGEWQQVKRLQHYVILGSYLTLFRTLVGIQLCFSCPEFSSNLDINIRVEIAVLNLKPCKAADYVSLPPDVFKNGSEKLLNGVTKVRPNVS
ncbi:unnamed protein product [Heterobilharzia americana]|nr:unnamed protein product [Heterobilharzia americana]